MYTLVLTFVLMGGQNSAPSSVAATHISGFRTKADCQSALSKERKALGGNVGSQGFGSPTAPLSVWGDCVEVQGTRR